MKKIYLASASPRRVELLKVLGLPFEQVISKVPETAYLETNPAALAETLALAKARAVAGKEGRGLVIGADTIVVYQGEILGKPRDRNDAVQMLTLLSGGTHLVISGVALVDAEGGRELVNHEITRVTFRDLSPEEIGCYADTGEPMDKAGAYGIQGIGGILVKEIHGCYNNVVGLPLTLLVELLKEMGFDVWMYLGKEGECGAS